MQNRNPARGSTFYCWSVDVHSKQVGVIGQLTLDAYDKLAGRSVPGLIVHFVLYDARSLFKVGAWLLAHQYHTVRKECGRGWLLNCVTRKRGNEGEGAKYLSDLSAVSVAVGGFQVTVAVSFPGSAALSRDGGHLIFGGSVSEISKRFCRQDVVLPSHSCRAECENRRTKNQRSRKLKTRQRYSCLTPRRTR